MVSELSVSMI